MTAFALALSVTPWWWALIVLLLRYCVVLMLLCKEEKGNVGLTDLSNLAYLVDPVQYKKYYSGSGVTAESNNSASDNSNTEHSDVSPKLVIISLFNLSYSLDTAVLLIMWAMTVPQNTYVLVAAIILVVVDVVGRVIFCLHCKYEKKFEVPFTLFRRMTSIAYMKPLSFSL